MDINPCNYVFLELLVHILFFLLYKKGQLPLRTIFTVTYDKKILSLRLNPVSQGLWGILGPIGGAQKYLGSGIPTMGHSGSPLGNPHVHSNRPFSPRRFKCQWKWGTPCCHCLCGTPFLDPQSEFRKKIIQAYPCTPKYIFLAKQKNNTVDYFLMTYFRKWEGP